MKTEPSDLVDPDLLRQIDDLFACGIGAEVDLPQLVVVGQQSSGKSSVLEGLTGIPFPREDGLCTRFATQIIFRRAKVPGLCASIIPDKSSSVKHKLDCAEWGKTVQVFDAPDIVGIMAEAREVMGVSGNTTKKEDEGRRPAFSKDVLTLEIIGPEQQHFSIIDVPGTFKVCNNGVTTKEDIDFVDSLVKNYTKNARCIMLTVVNCNTDIASQDIVEKARDADKEGNRTLGILTKPDLVDKGAEQSVIDIVKGFQHELKLGWHVLRNRGQAQLNQVTSLADRHSEEESFFSNTSPWNGLRQHQVGIASLKVKLQDILAGHLRSEIPIVRREVVQRLSHARGELDEMGAKRHTRLEQARYLSAIAQRFRDFSDAAIKGDWSNDVFSKRPELRLANAIRKRTEAFAADVARYGHEYQLARLSRGRPEGQDGHQSDENDDDEEIEKDHSDDDSEGESEDGSDRSIDSDEDTSKGLDKHEYQKVPTRRCGTPDGLEAILPEHDAVDHPHPGDEAWLGNAFRDSQGLSLIAIPPGLLGALIKVQAHKWEPLTLGYISDIICLVHDFIMKTLDMFVSSPPMRAKLLATLMDSLEASYREAIEWARDILDCELNGDPATHNHYFNDEVQRSRWKRLRKALQGKIDVDEKNEKWVRLADLCSTQNMGNDEYTISELHDYLRAYYKVARKRFVDNIWMQVVDKRLVRGKKSPLHLFSADFVLQLADEELESIAGEQSSIKEARTRLEQKIARLESGVKILRKIK